MNIFGITTKSIIITAVILLLIGIAAYGTSIFLDRWTDEIVRTNTALTQETVKKITTASASLIDSLDRHNFFSRETLTKNDWRNIDNLFSSISAKQAFSVVGMEGGFYFVSFDEMIGYSWPTAPDPAPAYGPAPRSYPIIKSQILKSISLRKSLLEFHTFDFAVFPLATEPIILRDRVVGGTWARIHVERELPSSKLLRILNFVAIVAVGALGAALILLWIRRRHVNAIRAGLDLVKLDPSYRLPLESGVYGAIAASINSMVDALIQEQRKREQLERDLHQQDKMATLGKLIAGVAHEVKTPLAVIKTRIQMWQRDLRQEKPEGELRTTISDDSMVLVVKEINRLSNLVKRLLVFAKPTQNKFQRHNINDVVRQTALIIQVEAENKQINVLLECAEDLPLLEFDHQAMEQVCINLCVNAVESMQDHGTLTITTSISGAGGSVVVQFKDTGKGIPEELRQKIFDPFFTTKEHGVGLGLSISYEIVKAHGGKIEFIPTEGEGATCRITLPIHFEQRK
jgi:signal transduction histidine kinase